MTTHQYKRPSWPAPESLRASTASLRKSNRRLAAKLGVPFRKVGPLLPGELAPAIRAQNEGLRDESDEEEIQTSEDSAGTVTLTHAEVNWLCGAAFELSQFVEALHRKLKP